MPVTVTSTLTLDLGDDVELSAAFLDENDDPANPDTVTVVLVAPDGTSTVYVAGVAPEVSNTVVGTYVFVDVPSAVGLWQWTFSGTGGGVEAAESGGFAVSPAPDSSAAPYDRWGMTVDAAVSLTGVAAISTASLTNAEEELVDELGWRPDPDLYGDPDPTALAHDVRARAFGRAVAWQAAMRAGTPASASDGSGSGEVASEMIASEYQVAYRASSSARADERLAPRARKLLADAGWFAAGSAFRSSPGLGALPRLGSTSWQTS